MPPPPDSPSLLKSWKPKIKCWLDKEITIMFTNGECSNYENNITMINKTQYEVQDSG